MIARPSLALVKLGQSADGRWPLELAHEAALLLERIVPRCKVVLSVPDRDLADRPIAIGAMLDDLKSHISEIVGGVHARVAGEGRYLASSRTLIRENTTELVIFVPSETDPELPLRLLDLCVGFGCSTRQETVQVEADGRGYWLPTYLIRDTQADHGGAGEEENEVVSELPANRRIT